MPPCSTTNRPHRTSVLVAEDDTASGAFFRMALERLDCHVTLLTDGGQALEVARRQHFDLLVLDRRLPGAGAEAILSTLRADPRAASRDAPALATSAELDARARRELADAGFSTALEKPLALAALHAGVREALPTYTASSLLLDHDAALEQSGSAQALDALRMLFTGELEKFLADLAGSPPAADELAERLHRLMASCGFCGATALGEAARTLKKRLDTEGTPPTSGELDALAGVMRRTLDALGTGQTLAT